MRKSPFVVVDDSEPNLFGWTEDSDARRARIAKLFARRREDDYEVWKRSVAKHLREDYCVTLQDAFDWGVTSDEALRAAYEKNKEAFRVVDAIADQEDWDPNLAGPRGAYLWGR